MERAKFIDYRSVSLILSIIAFSFLVAFLVFYPIVPLPLSWKIVIGLVLILAAGVVASRKLSARILYLTDELTESGVHVRTKTYKEQIDSASKELSQLNRELKRRIYELHNLFQISLDLTAILDLDQLVNSYLNTLIGQIRIKNALLYLVDLRKRKTLLLVKTKGIEEEDVDETSIEIIDPVVKVVFKKRQPVLIAEEFTSLRNIERFRPYGSEVIAPLIHSHKLVGLVLLGSKINGEAYTQTDLEMLTLITNIVAVAIANAQLYQKVRETSITDELTGLYNYRYFRIRLRDEVFRARRTGRPVSLAILDVDNFKHYNDTLGHPAGDQVLKQIARILQKSVRDTDVVARYGGEEFCVILPEVDVDGSVSFAERLRKNVEEHPFFMEETQPGGKVTISIGVATYPKDASIMKELIVRADVALYRAKRNGRNQVCLYSQPHCEAEAKKGTEPAPSGKINPELVETSES